MTRFATVLAFALFAAGCHAHQAAGDARPKSAANVQPAQKDQTPQVRSARPVRTTPDGFISADGLRKIQSALAKKGERVEATGKMDAATQTALQQFQKKQAQPATGFPDFDTLKRLGLDPKQIYLGQSK